MPTCPDSRNSGWIKLPQHCHDMLRRVGLAVAGGTAYAGAVFGGYMYTKYGGDGGGGGCGCGCDDAAARRAREGAAVGRVPPGDVRRDRAALRRHARLGRDGARHRADAALPARVRVRRRARARGRHGPQPRVLRPRARVTSLLQTDASAPMLEVAARARATRRRARRSRRRSRAPTGPRSRPAAARPAAGAGTRSSTRSGCARSTSPSRRCARCSGAARPTGSCCCSSTAARTRSRGSRACSTGAQAHAAKWGCVYNRDIDAIVAESGLRVLRRHTFHFGTTYAIVGAPAPRVRDVRDAGVLIGRARGAPGGVGFSAGGASRGGPSLGASVDIPRPIGDATGDVGARARADGVTTRTAG